MTKLSIITINRNNAEGLRKTMNSVFAQTCKEFEYIVIDGASTDNSVDVIKTSALQAEGLTFTLISEPDTGIYNAMNKGLKMCHGEYTLMLNSGDFLVDEHVIEQIMPDLDGTDIVQGNNIEERVDGVYRNRGYGKSDIDMSDVVHGHFLHQASFCRRDLFNRYGYFDENYRIGADTKFFLNCLGVHDATFRYVDVDVCNYDLTGVSADNSSNIYRLRLEENKRLLNELFSSRVNEYVFANEKKVALYNQLHRHKWVWNIVMFIKQIDEWIYGKQQSVTTCKYNKC